MAGIVHIGRLALMLLMLAAMPLAAQQRGVTIEPRQSPATQLKLGDAYALVIGNNQYKHLPTLQTAVSDAAAVAELLRTKYEFVDVRLLLNASRADILGALNRYRRDLEPEDRLLIYYAGHGLLDRQAEEGYWLPVDADEDSNIDWISNASITAALKAMLARHVMIVADSCYSGALTRGEEARAVPAPGTDRLAWLARVAEKRARTALVSGGLEPVVDGGRNGHSVFASAFLDVLRENTGLLDGQGLFDRLKGRVVVNAEQTPAYGNVRFAYHEGGDFIFAPRGALALTRPAPPVLPRPPSAAADPCLLVWPGIANSELAADFELFLTSYPDCPMAPFARARLEALKAKSQVAALTPPAESAFAVEDRDERLVALKNVNVRGEPSTDGRKLTTLRQGSKVAVTGRLKDRDWLRVALADGKTGYVWARLLGEPSAGPSVVVAPSVQSLHPDVMRARGNCALLRNLGERYVVPEEMLYDACAAAGEKVAVGVYPKQQEATGRKVGESFRDCAECPEMVVLPAGSFTMGSTEQERQWAVASGLPAKWLKDEVPQRRVTIRYALAVGKYEVTRGEFATFVAATGYEAKGCYVYIGAGVGWSRKADAGWNNPGFEQTRSHPVTCVNWNDAQAYAEWLSRLTGKHYRLLSEAEWEYAARAGMKTPFHTGDRIALEQANFAGHYSFNGNAKGIFRRETVPVGTFLANGFGIHDMHGNVSEWVEDCKHDNYDGAPTNGEAWTSGSCELRVRRGGSWHDHPRQLRSAARLGAGSRVRFSEFGIRVARTLSR